MGDVAIDRVSGVQRETTGVQVALGPARRAP
jgi:hypothetical protein